MCSVFNVVRLAPLLWMHVPRRGRCARRGNGLGLGRESRHVRVKRGSGRCLVIVRQLNEAPVRVPSPGGEVNGLFA